LAFGQLAEANLQAMAQPGVKKIVSICPHCVRTIAQDWREFGAEVQIEHHSEFLARHVNAIPRDGQEKRIVYHDPCYLGRYRDIYDPPREVARLGGQVLEAPRSRQRSFCCGAGGGLVFLGEETGDRVSTTRAKELVATGAQTIAAACPFCNTMFRDALAGQNANAPELLDIAQIAMHQIEAHAAAISPAN
jgi:Fe-S oxidoreductase